MSEPARTFRDIPAEREEGGAPLPEAPPVYVRESEPPPTPPPPPRPITEGERAAFVAELVSLCRKHEIWPTEQGYDGDPVLTREPAETWISNLRPEKP